MMMGITLLFTDLVIAGSAGLLGYVIGKGYGEAVGYRIGFHEGGFDERMKTLTEE